MQHLRLDFRDRVRWGQCRSIVRGRLRAHSLIRLAADITPALLATHASIAAEPFPVFPMVLRAAGRGPVVRVRIVSRAMAPDRVHRPIRPVAVIVPVPLAAHASIAAAPFPVFPMVLRAVEPVPVVRASDVLFAMALGRARHPIQRVAVIAPVLRAARA